MICWNLVYTAGSPPLTRGVQTSLAVFNRTLRITPAYAGSTYILFQTRRTAKDHPRLRGEYYNNLPWRWYGEGSPPLTRGVLATLNIPDGMTGITPAYAGSTHFLNSTRKLVQDHPRLRGEYWVYILIAELHIGSPPLTRGVQNAYHLQFCSKRITPAYAGSTC